MFMCVISNNNVQSQFVFDAINLIKHMDVWIKFHAEVLITDEVSPWAFKLSPLMVAGMMPLCQGGILKVDFTTAMLCCCLQFPGVS